jgi:RNA polymerase sigma factor (sigma-70 family)
MDLAIEPFLRASLDAEEERLNEIIQNAQPIVRRVVASRLSGMPYELDDICSETRLELLLVLRRLKADPSANPIEDFSGYAARVANNACHRYFRSRNPQRARLRNQIRYLFSTEEGLAIQDQTRPKCGLKGWNLDAPSGAPPERSSVDGDRDLARFVKSLFEQHRRPIAFDSLVELIARTWEIPARPTISLEDNGSLDFPDFSDSVEARLDKRRFIERLWTEIRALPGNQRVALLLHSRDGRGYPVLQLVQLTGIAFFPEMASLLQISEDKLASLWNELPLDDHAIAEMLGCSRQQVINFRMAARKRLTNRLRGGK